MYKRKSVDVMVLYSSIHHEADLRALKEALDNRKGKTIPTEKLVEMAKFVLENNYFELREKGKVKQ